MDRLTHLNHLEKNNRARVSSPNLPASTQNVIRKHLVDILTEKNEILTNQVENLKRQIR